MTQNIVISFHVTTKEHSVTADVETPSAITVLYAADLQPNSTENHKKLRRGAEEDDSQRSCHGGWEIFRCWEDSLVDQLKAVSAFKEKQWESWDKNRTLTPFEVITALMIKLSGDDRKSALLCQYQINSWRTALLKLNQTIFKIPARDNLTLETSSSAFFL